MKIQRTGSDIIDRLLLRVSHLENKVNRIETQRTPTVPFYDNADLPPGVEGQTAILDSVDSSQGFGIYIKGRWITIGGVSIELIYVGTSGVDGIDALLAGNPHPYATGDSPGPPPFDNGTTVPSNPLAFARLKDILLLFGGFDGVTAGQSIFTLPAYFTPASDQPISFLMSDFSALCAVNVQADSQVIYQGSSAITFA